MNSFYPPRIIIREAFIGTKINPIKLTVGKKVNVREFKIHHSYCLLQYRDEEKHFLVKLKNGIPHHNTALSKSFEHSFCQKPLHFKFLIIIWSL